MKYMKNCFAMILAICMLFLSGCSGEEVPPDDHSGLQAAPAAQKTARDNSSPIGMAAGNPDKRLRSICWEDTSSLSDNGFFSLGQEVLTDKSANGNFYNGARLYYNDCVTRQSKPLTVPNTPGGYLLEDDCAYLEPFIFTTGKKLFVRSGQDIESYNLDLSGHKHIVTLDNLFDLNSFYTDGDYLYYSNYYEDKNTGPTIYRTDLENGKTTEICTLNPYQNIYIGYNTFFEDKIPIEEHTVTGTDNTTLSVELLGLDPETGTMETFYTIDTKGNGLACHRLIDNQIFWHVIGENTLHQYNPDTGEERTITISDTPYLYLPEEVWDGKMILSARPKDSIIRIDYFTVDLATGTAQPMPYKPQVPVDADDYFLSHDYIPKIIDSYEDYYILSVGNIIGDRWLWDAGQNKPRQVDTPPSGVDPEVTGIFTGGYNYACSFATDFALVKKDDYWSGKTEYLPFTIVP